MPQEKSLNEIKVLGNTITKSRLSNSDHPVYTVKKNEVQQWFGKIQNFTLNESVGILKEKLEIFINENISSLNTGSLVLDETLFQTMRHEFRECFINTDYYWAN
jgi:hypothetical protein